MSIQSELDKKLNIRRRTKKFLGVNWKVDKRFFSYVNKSNDDFDWNDWTISSRKGTIFRSGTNGESLFALIPCKYPNAIKNTAIRIGFSQEQCEVADGELYVRGTGEQLKLFFKLIKRKFSKPRKQLSEEQKEKRRVHMEYMTSKSLQIRGVK